MRALLVVLSVTMNLGPGSVMAAEQVEPVANPAVDALFADYDQPGTPGCALGVIEDGEFVYRRGYGSANLDYDLPLTPQSVFRIGSTSKQVTAMAVALLAESGKISLEDSLRTWFPEFPEWADGITIRQLIHHTSGIRDYLTLAYLTGKGEDADYYTDEWVLELLARQRETNFPPGSQYLYSNSGYLLLAHLVQRASGQSLRKFSQENIFGPLGMVHTHFHDDHTEVVPLRAYGYAPTDDGYQVSMTTLDMVGDGGVFTSIDDLLLWDRNFYNNILGETGDQLIEQVTTPGVLDDGTMMDYAFGLSVDDYKGLKMISHGGAFVGYRAEMIRFPQHGFSVAVLCNRSDAGPSMLARRVADIYLGMHMIAIEEPPTETVDIELSSEELERYTGDFWEAEEAFAAESRVVDGKLWAIHSPTRRNELVPVGPNRFRMVGTPAEVFVDFTMDENGIVEVTRTINGEPRGRFKPFDRRQVSVDELGEYTGAYYSPELDTHYFLSLDGGSLVFKLDDEAPEELTAMFGETFENPDYGSVIFQRDENGSISGYTLQSGRVRNLAFSKTDG